MIRRLLIANRGEIACRIARSAHELGIETIAIASELDRDARHVKACDRAVVIGPAAASESYLSISKIIAAARQTGADAIHPGYGFLAENADFAQAVVDAGLTFVGPTAEVIAKLGSKTSAAELAEQAGIPAIARTAIGSVPERFPVMVKAALGGGGKGMSLVRDASDLDVAIASAKRIAEAAFGSDELLVEEYIEGARHIEVQILADTHGNVVHLGERECSIQRRHQKVIEEAPAPALASELREEMTQAAITLARRVGYQSAGTVEMILAPDGRFFFLEVNTRLQVEHGVTEMTTGIDIVAEQLRIAAGEALRFDQTQVTFSGAAIEARICAEDPAAGDLPAVGRVALLREPASVGLRVDSGLSQDQTIGIDYDPMLAKLIAHGDTREQARLRLIRGLGELTIAGVATNRSALLRALDLPEFVAGKLDTQLWDRCRESIVGRLAEDRLQGPFAAVVAGTIRRAASRRVLKSLPGGFRLGGPAEMPCTLVLDGEALDVFCTALGPDRFRMRCGEHIESVTASLDDPPRGDGCLRRGDLRHRCRRPARRSSRTLGQGIPGLR